MDAVEFFKTVKRLCNGGAITPACVLNPKFPNLRKNMAYVEDVSE